MAELIAEIATQEEQSEPESIINGNKARLSVKKRHKEELREKLGLSAASTPTGGDERGYDYEFIDGDVR